VKETWQYLHDNEKLRSEVSELLVENARLDGQLARRDREVQYLQMTLRHKNLALDALHYVWCSGGCPGGVHRFGEHPPLTQEIVDEAKRNTLRLEQWWMNRRVK
jgi:hypothetical protein